MVALIGNNSSETSDSNDDSVTSTPRRKGSIGSYSELTTPRKTEEDRNTSALLSPRVVLSPQSHNEPASPVPSIRLPSSALSSPT